MLSLHTWPTANCLKVHIAVAELDLPHCNCPVDILTGAHDTEEFGKLDGNRRVPVLVDPDGPDGTEIVVADSAVILVYLAEKTGRLLPEDRAGRSDALQWLAFQAGGLGTFGGEALYYRAGAPERWPYAIERYTKEAARHFAVLEARLTGRDYVAGTYSIADIAIFPWIRIAWRLGQDLARFPHLHRWYAALAEREPIRRATEELLRLGGDAGVHPGVFSYAPARPGESPS